MREKDLPFDRTKHVCYTKNAKKCVQKLLRRYYDEATAAALWEKIQLQYCEYLKDEPALGSAKITVSIYDPILVFAWYMEKYDSGARTVKEDCLTRVGQFFRTRVSKL